MLFSFRPRYSKRGPCGLRLYANRRGPARRILPLLGLSRRRSTSGSVLSWAPDEQMTAPPRSRLPTRNDPPRPFSDEFGDAQRWRRQENNSSESGPQGRTPPRPRHTLSTPRRHCCSISGLRTSKAWRKLACTPVRSTAQRSTRSCGRTLPSGVTGIFHGRKPQKDRLGLQSIQSGIVTRALRLIPLP